MKESRGAGSSRATSVHITGLERSGKTTVAAFLDSHPEIDVPPVGTNMWHYFAFRYGSLSHRPNLQACLDDMMSYDRIRWLEPDRRTIEEQFARGEPTYGRLFSLILSDHAARSSKPIWGTQSAWLDWYVDDVFETDANSRVLHVLRDPRDRYGEVKSLWGSGRGQAGAAAAKWNLAVKLAAKNQRKHGTRYRLMRFEDLVGDPRGTLERVCSFMGVTFDDRMFTAVKRNMTEISQGVDKRPLVESLSSDQLRTSDRELDTREVGFIQSVTGRGRKVHGYETIDLEQTPRQELRDMVSYWPGQGLRYLGWSTIERLSRLMPRRFGERIDPDYVVEGVDA